MIAYTVCYSPTVYSESIPLHVIPSLLRFQPYSTHIHPPCSVQLTTCKKQILLKQFGFHIHPSCVLVTLGIKNSLQPKQLSKCLPRRHPQKHYNLNKTYVLTYLSPVLTQRLSLPHCTFRLLEVSWFVQCDILQNHS